jgi:uncharacterized integral membrane protein (TIGR00697 family)
MNIKLTIALTIYIVSLLAANTLGLKVMPFLFGTHLSVAIFYFPFVYLVTDVVGEVYGKTTARQFVLAGVVATVLFTIFNILSIVMPWSPKGNWATDAYNTIFGISVRMSIASVVAFIIAEYQDVSVFFYIRNILGTKHFWLRSNLSNIWSEFLDTGSWFAIAFIGVYPISTIVLMALPWWIFKVIMGMVYTPLSYLGLRLLNSKQTTAYENNHA